jgi:uncharacterized protein YxeA
MKNFLRLVLVAILALSLVGTASAATAGQRNALSKANSYLSISAFSKSGLKKQLKFDGFSSSDAGWAVNHVRVSWKAQAVKKAKSYLDITSFSKSGLIHQLEFDGFTHSQAVYGVSKAYH